MSIVGPSAMESYAQASVSERSRAARLWNYFNDQDEFYEIRLWPWWAQQLALSSHLSYSYRYELALFFLFNGLRPAIVEEWVLATDTRQMPGHRVLVSRGYDDAARAHVHSMIAQHESGDLYKNRRARMFDMSLGAPVRVQLGSNPPQ